MLNKYKGDIILIIAALVYGCGFVAQSAGNAMGPWSYSSARFLLGSLVLMPLAWYMRKKSISKHAVHKDDASEVRGSEKHTINEASIEKVSPIEREKEMTIREMLPGVIIVAIDLMIMVVTQQYALMYTTVGKTGFITSLYVILVPMAGLFILKRKIQKRVWIAAVVSVIGLYFISLSGGIEEVNKGDMLLIISALTCVVYVYLLEYYAARADAFTFTCLLFLFTGLLFAPGALILEDCTIEMVKSALIPLLYGGIGLCAAGYTLQMIGQKYVPAERATIILSLESLISLFAGMIILHEAMSTREYIGCGLIFIAVLLAETGSKQEPGV